ncbi:MAG: TetR/AcrR family transcriptional regulator [Muribaculaceae bacterium]|nr:TetR/AcrR family transcriptional regulator [Muribaculaceae bacterium]
MEPANEVKTRRPRRSKADIEEAIHKAAVAQIKKKGFSLALVTDIVKRAKIEPIVFYNRYKNLDEFYDEFVKNYDYWLSDLIRDSVEEIGSEEGYSNILEKLLTNLMQEEIMTELLRWEIAEGNHITERTSRLRELHAVELINSYSSTYQREHFDISAITALIVAGIYYLVLHKDRSTFAGIDINTIPGKRRMLKAIRSIASMMFRAEENYRLSIGNADDEAETYRRNYEAACRERVESDFRDHVEDLMEARRIADRKRIAENMRALGLPEDMIARCVDDRPDD